MHGPPGKLLYHFYARQHLVLSVYVRPSVRHDPVPIQAHAR